MKTNNLRIFRLLLWNSIFVLTACISTRSKEDPNVLVDTDRFYSAMSADKGMNTAFIAMFDSFGVMLRQNHDPIEGISSIKAILGKDSDSAFTLTWEPKYAKIAVSGELGYTYGTYKIRDKATDSISGEGTYVTVWQKQADGKWKALLDTGNSGLSKLK
jgi:ketosteroid isomerase-like protein